MDEMVQKLHLIDDRVRGAALIFNTKTILAIETDQPQEEASIAKITAGKGKGKKPKKKVNTEPDDHSYRTRS